MLKITIQYMIIKFLITAAKIELFILWSKTSFLNAYLNYFQNIVLDNSLSRGD